MHTLFSIKSIYGRTLFILGLFLAAFSFSASQPPPATATILYAPPGSEQYGEMVKFLPNGNLIVADPFYDDGEVENVGAVYLYDGVTLRLISKLTGSHANDKIGLDVLDIFVHIEVLPDGDFVVISPDWDNGEAKDAGAVTRCDAKTGCNGKVNATNSLVGGSTYDRVGGYFERNNYVIGHDGIKVLANGNYVVSSPSWTNGDKENVGAITLCYGATGCVGEVSPENSLVGTIEWGFLGWEGVIDLANGNYLVSAYEWGMDGAENAGAVTWCDGMTGCVGEVSAENSLVGTHYNDMIGVSYFSVANPGGVYALANGNYLVLSAYWNNDTLTDAGAVTWCDGTVGCTGELSAANSLVGTHAYDQLGENYKTFWSTEIYVVGAPHWDNGDISDTGAVRGCSTSLGCTGEMNVANSWVGTHSGDQLGSGGSFITGQRYLAASPEWDNETQADVGALTWCVDAATCHGEVSLSNSLVGEDAGVRLGAEGAVVLNNGNYVIKRPSWGQNGLTELGAVLWCDGEGGCTGTFSAENALVGSQPGDQVGFTVVTLPNGNYVVLSQYWQTEMVNNGAVTWCDGTAGCQGEITPENSLVGSGFVQPWDMSLLSNGNFLVSNAYWQNGGMPAAGQVTWCSGAMGCAGQVPIATTLFGSHAEDRVGVNYLDKIALLTDGDYVVSVPTWDNGALEDAGSVTWCDGTTGCGGEISSEKSLVGTHAGDEVGSGEPAFGDDYFLVNSPSWGDGQTPNLGAVTRCMAKDCKGVVSLENSFVGIKAGDLSGVWGVSRFMIFPDHYFVISSSWDNDISRYTWTWCNAVEGCTGQVQNQDRLYVEKMTGTSWRSSAYQADRFAMADAFTNRVIVIHWRPVMRLPWVIK